MKSILKGIIVFIAGTGFGALIGTIFGAVVTQLYVAGTESGADTIREIWEDILD